MRILNKRGTSTEFHQLIKALEGFPIDTIAHRLLDYYKEKLYVGNEHEEITQRYFQRILIDLRPWFSKNAIHFKQSEKKAILADNFFRKALINAKIDSFEGRRLVYHRWLGGEKICTHKSDLLCVLFKKYKTSDYLQVKIELDLIASKEELEEQLKKLTIASKVLYPKGKK